MNILKPLYQTVPPPVTSLKTAAAHLFTWTGLIDVATNCSQWPTPRFVTNSWCLTATYYAIDFFFIQMLWSFHRLLSIPLLRNTFGLVTRRK